MIRRKKSLLLEMIAFSTVDGHLHKKEYEFCFDCQSIEHRKGDLMTYFIKNYQSYL
jgi:hypothetical protein